jgi:hypothetical protein
MTITPHSTQKTEYRIGNRPLSTRSPEKSASPCTPWKASLKWRSSLCP